MESRLSLYICSLYKEEVSTLVSKGFFKGVNIVFYPYKPGCRNWEIEDFLSTIEVAEDSTAFLLCGVCLHSLISSKELISNFRFHTMENCFSMLCSQDVINIFTGEGAYITTAGWLKQWEKHIKLWGFNKKTCREYFKESFRKILFLDTLQAVSAKKDAEDFSAFVGLPLQCHPIGLEYCSFFLNGIINEYMLKSVQSELLDCNQEKSTTKMAMDLINQLTHLYDETLIIEKIIEIFRSLFAPEKLFYLSVDEEGNNILYSQSVLDETEREELKKELLSLTRNIEYCKSGKGFKLRLSFDIRLIGVVYIDKVQFPQYLRSYCNLALVTAPIFATILVNVEKFKIISVEKMKQELLAKVLELFIKNEEGVDEVQQILHYIKEFTKVDAIGIRFRKGQDYPYFRAIGFRKDFLEKENSLLVNELECPGKASLACTCGMVIQGLFPKSLTNSTKRGTLWTNDFKSDLKKIQSDSIVMRGRCLDEGYQSVAFVPINVGGETYGILQLCSKQKNFFSHSDITFLEQIALSVGIAFERKKHIEVLEETTKQANASNKAKTEFLSNMSHEIRTPMNSILGFSEILERKEMDVEKKVYIRNIMNSGNLLLSIINDILDLSKVESGKMELSLTTIYIPRFFNELEQFFSIKIKEKELEFIVKLDKSLPRYLILDEVRLRQILLNLIGNAIKFTHQGSIIVSVEAKEIRLVTSFNDSKDITRSCIDLVITVADTGIGIPEESHETIFNSFTQIDGHSTKKYGGTGLGLTITKKILELMDGTISLESKVGKGTTFTVLIRGIEIALGGHEEYNDTYESRLKIKFEPASILIVDDIEQNREILKNYLIDEGFNLFFATNGKEALEIVNETSLDCILLDMKMPVMNGFEVIKSLKSDAKTESIPIIVITAMALKQDEEKMSHLCNGYLRKPINRELLLTELMNFLPYERLKVDSIPQNESPDSDKSHMMYPETEELEFFHHLALNGIMSDIVAAATSLQERDERYAQFVDTILVLASQYEDEKIIEFIEILLKEREDHA